MKLLATPLADLFEIEITSAVDARGSFEKLFSTESLASEGIEFTPAQIALSCNAQRGTLRGLHFQRAPVPDPKLVFCSRGEVYDVAVDLRLESKTFSQWHAVRLGRGAVRALLIPGGFAHGFLTLSDECELLYAIAAPYRPELQSGIQWDDPDLGIVWPFAPAVMSDRDRSLGSYRAYRALDGAA